MPSKPRVLYWFRTDLRLHDSPALKAALDLSPECLYPIWCWDPHYVYRSRVGPNRWQFLFARPLSYNMRNEPCARVLLADLTMNADLIVNKTCPIALRS